MGQFSAVVAEGKVFDYFDGLRKIIEMANDEILFVDPYLNPDVVARYLPHVSSGVTIRLLGRRNIAALKSALEAFVQQTEASVQLRSSDSLHDRFLFVDRKQCYQSRASFKDGAKRSPTTLTQVTDGFQAMWDAYERLWNAAEKHLS